MSAAYRADFSGDVTHVCSAFENTPKTKLAREAAVPIVKGEWLRECRRLHRRLPENDFFFGPLTQAQAATSVSVTDVAAAPPLLAVQTRAQSPPAGDGREGGDGESPTKRPRATSSPAVKREKEGDGQEEDGRKVGFCDDVDSPAVTISKVTRVDDPVASLDLTSDSAPGRSSNGSVRRLGSEPSDLDMEGKIAASLKGDIAEFTAHLSNCGGDVVDVEDTARKAVVEAWKVAHEHIQEFVKDKRRGNPFDGFKDKWFGPLPQLLRDMVNGPEVGDGVSGGAAGRDAAELGEQVKIMMSSYETAVKGLMIEEEVRSWLADDLSTFEKFLRDTLDPESGEDVDIHDVARKGIVEALDMALKTWDEDGDLAAFHEQWEGPTPRGLKDIAESVESGDTGMLVHLLVKEKLSAYREAYRSALQRGQDPSA